MHTRRREDFTKDWRYLRRLASLQIRGENERLARSEQAREEDRIGEKVEDHSIEQGREETSVTDGSFEHSRRYAT